MAKREKDGKSATGIASDMERLTRLIRASEHRDGLNPAQWEALRYLTRANRFSNSPGALALYLGATKGTVSQTLKSLEAKGLVTKTPRGGKRGSLSLELTSKATEALIADPWTRFSADATQLRGKIRRRLAKGLTELLTTELARKGVPRFGACRDCRYFREDGQDDAPSCMFFDETLKGADIGRICVAFERRP
jgi:DNA-binding MarR family transcriptional regulator